MEDSCYIEFSQPTDYDRKKFEDAKMSGDCLDGRIKITAKDSDGNIAELFVENEVVDRLGEDYIRSHVKMHYNKVLCEWFLNLSQNDYYNDEHRNPEKVIKVEYLGDEGGTGREVYKGIETGRYYLRENYYPRERCARWYICGKRRTPDDGDEPRANLIFECNSQREKVRYDDWNGVAAYSDLFNEKFTEAAHLEKQERRTAI